MFGLGFGELLIIFLIALIFIGPKKLPELAKGLGQGIREFQKAAKGFSDQLQETSNELKKDETPKITETPFSSEDSETKVEATKEEKPS